MLALQVPRFATGLALQHALAPYCSFPQQPYCWCLRQFLAQRLIFNLVVFSSALHGFSSLSCTLLCSGGKPETYLENHMMMQCFSICQSWSRSFPSSCLRSFPSRSSSGSHSDGSLAQSLVTLVSWLRSGGHQWFALSWSLLRCSWSSLSPSWSPCGFTVVVGISGSHSGGGFVQYCVILVLFMVLCGSSVAQVWLHSLLLGGFGSTVGRSCLSQVASSCTCGLTMVGRVG